MRPHQSKTWQKQAPARLEHQQGATFRNGGRQLRRARQPKRAAVLEVLLVQFIELLQKLGHPAQQRKLLVEWLPLTSNAIPCMNAEPTSVLAADAVAARGHIVDLGCFAHL